MKNIKKQKILLRILFVSQLQQKVCIIAPVIPPELPHSSVDEAETDFFSDGDASSEPSSYLQACIRELANSNVLTKVL